MVVLFTIDSTPSCPLETCGSVYSMVASAVLRLLHDPHERSRLARAGRERVESHHTWQHAMARFDSIVERTLDEDGTSRNRQRPERTTVAGGRP